MPPPSPLPSSSSSSSSTSSSSPPFGGEKETVGEATSLLAIVVCGLTFNIMVIAVFANSKSLRSNNHNFLLMNLIVYDLLFIVISMSVSLVDVLCSLKCAHVIRVGDFCKATGFFTTFQGAMSSFTLAAIAIDRFMIVVHPNIPSLSDTKKSVFVTILLIWLCAILVATPPFIFPESVTIVFRLGTRHCSPSLKTSCWYYWFIVTLCMTSVVVAMIICYRKIVVEVRRQTFKHRRRYVPRAPISDGEEQSGDGTADTADTETNELAMPMRPKPPIQMKRKRLHKTVTKRGILLILAYLLCWLPYTVQHGCPALFSVPYWLEISGMWLVYSLVVINPIIYVFNNREFMKELKRLTKIHSFRRHCWPVQSTTVERSDV
ncbi:rhodopsin, GQ-coupled-like [Gigantopelta aegis]|uniref:rhodopsin, GQ-coupled-like n=1 Tax=Gigantopelta aegis TaxID=1735272 RepID=UPI001B88BE0A|nr:rhodopsin, GQ-coupled-like [Gigantopelta aegis]